MLLQLIKTKQKVSKLERRTACR